MALDQRVRELPLRVGERDAVPLELLVGGADGPQLLALARQRRHALLERFDAETPPLAPEATRCNRPQSRSTHPYRSIGKNMQSSSPQTGHFQQPRSRVG